MDCGRLHPSSRPRASALGAWSSSPTSSVPSASRRRRPPRQPQRIQRSYLLHLPSHQAEAPPDTLPAHQEAQSVVAYPRGASTHRAHNGFQPGCRRRRLSPLVSGQRLAAARRRISAASTMLAPRAAHVRPSELRERLRLGVVQGHA